MSAATERARRFADEDHLRRASIDAFLGGLAYLDEGGGTRDGR